MGAAHCGLVHRGGAYKECRFWEWGAAGVLGLVGRGVLGWCRPSAAREQSVCMDCFADRSRLVLFYGSSFDWRLDFGGALFLEWVCSVGPVFPCVGHHGVWCLSWLCDLACWGPGSES